MLRILRNNETYNFPHKNLDAFDIIVGVRYQLRHSSTGKIYPSAGNIYASSQVAKWFSGNIYASPQVVKWFSGNIYASSQVVKWFSGNIYASSQVVNEQ